MPASVRKPAARPKHRHEHVVCMPCVPLFSAKVTILNPPEPLFARCCFCGLPDPRARLATFPFMLCELRCSEWDFKNFLDHAGVKRRTA